MENIELQHHGIKGQKWGLRRYQNKDGTLTALGRKRYAREMSRFEKQEKVLQNKLKTKAELDRLEAKRRHNEELERQLKGPQPEKSSKKSDEPAQPKKKSYKEMTDEELRAAINNMQLQKQYSALYSEMNPKHVGRGKKFVGDFVDKAVIPAVTEGGKQLLKDGLVKAGKKALGLDEAADDTLNTLKKTAELMGYKSKIASAQDIIDRHNKRKAEEADEARKKKQEADKKKQEADKEPDSSDSKPKSDPTPKPNNDEPEIIVPKKVVEQDFNTPSVPLSVEARRYLAGLGSEKPYGATARENLTSGQDYVAEHYKMNAIERRQYLELIKDPYER